MPSTADSSGNVEFNRDVRPILSDRCFSCHGPDAAAVAKSGGLRLDSFDDATKPTSDGHVPIVPGKPEDSYIFKRIQDSHSPMPPLDSGHEPLSQEEIKVLKSWVSAGAEYQPHWAFTPVQQPEIPMVQNTSWPINRIDHFVLEQLEQREITPAPSAEPATLLRRLSLVLTGIAPTLGELADFLADPSPQAYEAAVDRLLASPRYGEHYAVPWLDVGRYADSHGFHHDEFRPSWPYRDWVVKALNDNMPYDQFLIEQIAGDLLPEPTEAQLIASGFNRNHMINDEGGAIDAEYRVEAVADRVETYGTAALGLTMNCCRCHDHKYDPIEHQDYFNLYAFFNSMTDQGVYPHGTIVKYHAAAPYLELPTEQQSQQRQLAEEKLATAKAHRQKLKDAPEAERKQADEEVKTAQAELNEVVDQILRVMISEETETPRPAYVLNRGAYDAPMEDRPAHRLPPKFLGGKLPDDAPSNRLGLAYWTVNPENPLTARVHANRLWTQIFGRGLHATQGDFGNQSPLPLHRPLLDYLAHTFMQSGWDQKQLLKEIVMSQTFRQSSQYRPNIAAQDPDNQWLASFPRRRLPAESLRDHLLASAKLLVEQLGGPPVKPYQPPGLWQELAIPGSRNKTYRLDSGDNLYRRSLYTVIKRTSGPPILSNFDGPSREVCTPERSVSNTPLQSLQLWNDEQFLEISRVFAVDLLSSSKAPEAAFNEAFLRLTSRTPTASELTILMDLLAEMSTHFANNPEDARQFIAYGEAPVPEHLPAHQIAAWTACLNTLLSLDEAINLN